MKNRAFRTRCSATHASSAQLGRWKRICLSFALYERSLGLLRPSGVLRTGFFAPVTTSSYLSKADLNAFSPWSAETKNLKPKTINNTLAAGTVALRWAGENELIASNPAAGLVKFSGTPAKRGVLTEQEVQRLFAQPWADERAWLWNILAMSTGLRVGEVLAVQLGSPWK